MFDENFWADEPVREDDSWYIPYTFLTVAWEAEVFEEVFLSPSKFQERLIKYNRKKNLTEKVIEDFTAGEQRYFDEAYAYALPLLQEFHNFSLGMDDVTVENYRSTQRIVRWHERIFANQTKFKEGMNYMGIFWQAILNLNYEVRLLPIYDSILEYIRYDYKKAFDLDEIMKIMADINIVSMQIDLRFMDMYDFIPNTFCKRTIRYHQRNIYKAAGHLYDFVSALNKSRPFEKADGSKSKPFEDREVMKHLRLVKRECR